MLSNIQLIYNTLCLAKIIVPNPLAFLLCKNVKYKNELNSIIDMYCKHTNNGGFYEYTSCLS